MNYSGKTLPPGRRKRVCSVIITGEKTPVKRPETGTGCPQKENDVQYIVTEGYEMQIRECIRKILCVAAILALAAGPALADGV